MIIRETCQVTRELGLTMRSGFGDMRGGRRTSHLQLVLKHVMMIVKLGDAPRKAHICSAHGSIYLRWSIDDVVGSGRRRRQGCSRLVRRHWMTRGALAHLVASIIASLLHSDCYFYRDGGAQAS
jgi:hypothetical protein